jgi:hypothetical protein
MTLRRTAGITLAIGLVALSSAFVSAKAADDGKKAQGGAAEIQKAFLLDRNSGHRQPQEIPLDGLLTFGCSVDLGTDGYWLVHVWGDYADGRLANDLAKHGWIRLAAVRPSQKKALDDCNRFVSEVEGRTRPKKQKRSEPLSDRR